MITDSQELLEQFVKNGSETAFRELLTRYIDLVYSAALRLTCGDTHRAQDVTQIVFADLARMAGKLSDRTRLGGWLHRHTCFVARNLMRGERRRIAREREAVQMSNDDNGSALAAVAPVLDEAIQELGGDDRDVILLRFFERRSLREVGDAIGINENVAQKRVARAVKELGRLLQARGVALSGSALAGCLAAGAVQAAPAGLALGIAAKVIGGAAAKASTAASVALSTKLKFAGVGAVVMAGLLVLLLFQLWPERPRNVDPSRPVSNEPITTAGEALDPESTPTAENLVTIADTTNVATRPTESTEEPLPSQEQAAAPDKPDRRAVRPIMRLFKPKASGVLRIEGNSNLGAWRVQSSLIGGYLEIDSAFNQASAQSLKRGLVYARARVFIPTQSLKNVGPDGEPFSAVMDDLLLRTLQAAAHPRISFQLTALMYNGSSNVNEQVHHRFQAYGGLAVAGVTNHVGIPVRLTSLGDYEITVSGTATLRMTAFKIAPPTANLGSEFVRFEDEFEISFDWVLERTGQRAFTSMDERVPLWLTLPSPAFKQIPGELFSGPLVEPVSATPRPVLLVPRGLQNVARGSLVASSDANVSANALAKIIDSDKSATDQSIIYLRKGTQWVQLDLKKPHEIFALAIWHAHNAPKIYHDVVVQVSDDPQFKENVQTVYNNDADNSSGLGAGTDPEYVETYEGRLVPTGGVTGRYVRFYSKGSTESALNEYTEIEIYGRPGE